MSAPSDIDPKSEDMATRPRRRRRRDQPEPSAHLKAEKAKLLTRALRRPLSPGIMAELDGEGYTYTAPHSDPDLWELTLADAFATRSESVIRSFINELEGLCSRAWDVPNEAWKPNETQLNAILAMVASAQPKTVAQAALVAQSIAVHLLTMRLASQALNRGGMVMERDAALVGKLARTYAQQMDTLQAMQGKQRSTRQTIKVSKELHQHVHYYTNTPGGQETDGQAHDARAATVEERPALPCPEQGGSVVRMPRRAR